MGLPLIASLKLTASSKSSLSKPSGTSASPPPVQELRHLRSLSGFAHTSCRSYFDYRCGPLGSSLCIHKYELCTCIASRASTGGTGHFSYKPCVRTSFCRWCKLNILCNNNYSHHPKADLPHTRSCSSMLCFQVSMLY